MAAIPFPPLLLLVVYSTQHGHPEYRADRNSVLCLPQLTVLVSIQADRPGAWFSGPLDPYPTFFPGIGLSRDFERVKVPGNPAKSPFCVVFLGVKFLRSLFAHVDSRIT
jgi:hypothetical protein